MVYRWRYVLPVIIFEKGNLITKFMIKSNISADDYDLFLILLI